MEPKNSNNNCNDNVDSKIEHLKEELQHEKADIKKLQDELNQEIKDVDHLEKELEDLEHHHHKEVTLIVNGQPKQWHHDEISYEQVVELAFPKHNHNPDIVYSVTYSKGPDKKPSGSMSPGDKVCVKNKMIFNVVPTNRS